MPVSHFFGSQHSGFRVHQPEPFLILSLLRWVTPIKVDTTSLGLVPPQPFFLRPRGSGLSPELRGKLIQTLQAVPRMKFLEGALIYGLQPLLDTCQKKGQCVSDTALRGKVSPV